jgi:hypothetical protein
MYIEGSIAYFCEEGTRGDDWDDRYRYYNAGPPNRWVSRVIWWLPEAELADDALSVAAINAGAVAWLSYWPSNTHLAAGVPTEEFVDFTRDCGGQAFVMEEEQ